MRAEVSTEVRRHCPQGFQRRQKEAGGEDLLWCMRRLDEHEGRLDVRQARARCDHINADVLFVCTMLLVTSNFCYVHVVKLDALVKSCNLRFGPALALTILVSMLGVGERVIALKPPIFRRRSSAPTCWPTR